MDELHKSFIETLKHIGLKNVLPTAVFYKAPIGIRFEVGNFKKIYLHQGINPVYLRAAFYRAKTLFDNLPAHPNILRIDSYQQDLYKLSLKEIGLSEQDEKIQELIYYDDWKCLQQHLYWDLSKINMKQINSLLLEIVKADIGGINALVSNVYFVNTDCNLLYHLYDDRGVDIVAKDKGTLYPLYKKYNDWILKYDKEKIDLKFAEI